MPRAELSFGWLALSPSEHRHFYRYGVQVCEPGERVFHGPGDMDHNHPGNCFECQKELCVTGSLFPSKKRGGGEADGVCDPCPRHTQDGSAGRHLIGRFR